MLSFTNIGAGFYAAVGPKGRTDRFVVVRFANATFGVLNVNRDLRDTTPAVLAAGAVCRTVHGQDAAMAVVGSRSFDVTGEHHTAGLRTLVAHLTHHAKVTGRLDDATMKAAIAFFTELASATATQS